MTIRNNSILIKKKDKNDLVKVYELQNNDYD
jgi:hypothetical protein